MTAPVVRDTRTSCPDCGFVSALTTAGLAAYALRIHSCERWTDLAERKARGDAQRARVDRTPKPCTHRTPHVHGTHAAYALDQCRCQPCAHATREYERTRIRRTAYGTWQPFVDATPAREHIRALMAQGMGWKRIADAAGMSSGSMTKLLYGLEGREPSRRIRPDSAARVLQVRLDLADGALVAATGTWRRLEALVAIGYPKSLLAARLGLHRALQFDRAQVTVGNARKVRALYDELADTPGPSTRARNDAARAGYLPPLWWDDDTIDDPTFTPATTDTPLRWDDVDPVALELARAGRDPGRALTRAERIACVLTLRDAGLSLLQIGERLGIAPRQVSRDLNEHGEKGAA